LVIHEPIAMAVQAELSGHGQKPKVENEEKRPVMSERPRLSLILAALANEGFSNSDARQIAEEILSKEPSEGPPRPFESVLRDVMRKVAVLRRRPRKGTGGFSSGTAA